MDMVNKILQDLGGLSGAHIKLGAKKDAIKKWRRNGIPSRYHLALLGLGYSDQEISAASSAQRPKAVIAKTQSETV